MLTKTHNSAIMAEQALAAQRAERKVKKTKTKVAAVSKFTGILATLRSTGAAGED